MSGDAAIFAGFWEEAVFLQDGLKLAGWTARRDTGEPPEMLLLAWGSQSHRFRPTVVRRDVGQALGTPALVNGFETLIPIGLDLRDDWSSASLIALWQDGTAFTLALRPSLSVNDFRALEFKTFSDFQRSFQNPATRIAHPRGQAYAARRALRIAGPEHAFWMAAAVIALYRHIDNGVPSRSEAEQVIEEWQLRCSALPMQAEGELMRWAISMHLAVCYATLSWGKPDEAKAAFPPSCPTGTDCTPGLRRFATSASACSWPGGSPGATAMPLPRGKFWRPSPAFCRTPSAG